MDCGVNHGALHHRQPQGGELPPPPPPPPPLAGAPSVLRVVRCSPATPFSVPSPRAAALLCGCGCCILHRAPGLLHHAPPLDHQATGAGGLVSAVRGGGASPAARSRHTLTLPSAGSAGQVLPGEASLACCVRCPLCCRLCPVACSHSALPVASLTAGRTAPWLVRNRWPLRPPACTLTIQLAACSLTQPACHSLPRFAAGRTALWLVRKRWSLLAWTWRWETTAHPRWT